MVCIIMHECLVLYFLKVIRHEIYTEIRNILVTSVDQVHPIAVVRTAMETTPKWE